MRSNTKLSGFEKKVLAAMREEQKDVKIVNDGITTVAYLKFPNTVEFSTSVSSPEEKKFRAKVGEFYARNRMDSGETVKMTAEDFDGMLTYIFGIAAY
jgi:hypothetical protein